MLGLTEKMGWLVNNHEQITKSVVYMAKKMRRLSNLNSLSNSRRHSANADVIADVKSYIIVSRRHFFADVIFFYKSSKLSK